VVEPAGIGDPPSGFGTVAVSVAVPTVRPFTLTLVLAVKVPVGLTIDAGVEIESEIGVVLVVPSPVDTVAVMSAVCPTTTNEMSENVTDVTLSPGADAWGLA